MTANEIVKRLSEVEGIVSIHEGIATLEDGTTILLEQNSAEQSDAD